jgi:hypothetical protein
MEVKDDNFSGAAKEPRDDVLVNAEAIVRRMHEFGNEENEGVC